MLPLNKTCKDPLIAQPDISGIYKVKHIQGDEEWMSRQAIWERHDGGVKKKSSSRRRRIRKKLSLQRFVTYIDNIQVDNNCSIFQCTC